MVTDRRLRWVPHMNLRFEALLALDQITGVSEKSLRHRYAIALDHGPITRPHAVPAHRFLGFEWGDSVAATTMTRTELAFSRRDTKAAQTLRDQLSRHMTL